MGCKSNRCMVALVVILLAGPRALARHSPPPEGPGREPGAPAAPKIEAPASKHAGSRAEKPKAVITPAKAMQAANRFADVAPCVRCRGTGKVMVGVEDAPDEVGRGTVGPGIKVRRSHQEERGCQACAGNRLNSAEKLLRAGDELIEALAKVDQGDAAWVQAREHVLRKLSEAASRGLVSWGGRLYGEVSARLSSSGVKEGRPILFVGALKGDEGEGAGRRMTIEIRKAFTIEAEQARRAGISADAARGDTAIVECPALAAATPGSLVLVGATFVKLESDPTRRYVLKGGFVVQEGSGW